jgi:hypothetical protein
VLRVSANGSGLTIGLRRIFDPLAALAGLALSAFVVSHSGNWQDRPSWYILQLFRKMVVI